MPLDANNGQSSSKVPSTQPVQTQGNRFPIVGIGASAGGLAAFEAFFRNFPQVTSAEIAFVVVQHLSPEHESNLAELLRSYTDMPVYSVVTGIQIRPNCVYVLPPSHDLAIHDGVLNLLPPTEPRSHRLPIDFFFSSLAQDQHQLAIGIILSGSGSDGSHGVRAIKSAGGMVMAQTPESAEFCSMPLSAIETGMVDFISPVAEMPNRLLTFVTQLYGSNQFFLDARPSQIADAIEKIFVLIRLRTGHDFSRYKPSTIDRRIERRMAVYQLKSLDEYVARLNDSPSEIDALFQDLLIGVTGFFRDPEAFEKLEQVVLPEMLAEKLSTGNSLRVWVSGCSSGEEAYSIAILLHEQLEAVHASIDSSTAVQIFASDIDTRAISLARAGLFPQSIRECVSPKRLVRYFNFESDSSSYRIHKKIRDMVVFSEHDVNKDPPFSKLDLISCRNLMIYLGSELQHRLIPLFHFALNPNGVLFLGASEGVGEFEQLFAVIDRKAKLYRRKPDMEGMPKTRWNRSSAIDFIPTDTAQARVAHTLPVKPPLRTVTEQAVLSILSPTAVLVDERGNVLYLLGRTGSFLEPAAGEPGVHNIFKMAREGLRQTLVTTLRKVVATDRPENVRSLPVKSNGHYTRFDLTISPVYPAQVDSPGKRENKMYVVLLVELKEVTGDEYSQPAHPASDQSASPSQSNSATTETDAIIAELSSQLQAKEEYLQSTQEELETANEELMSSNEELQSVNEELQSTNEELETSKEELQSINEELATVNSELQNKVTDLSRLNNDMNNLLSGSGIATIFVDTKLCILRFTPAMSTIINLIHSDVGRPVGHIVSNLVGYDRLVADVQTVLDTLESQERRVQTASGLWFQMRIKPYRTIENVIEGVVITFVDVTDMKQAEDRLRATNHHLRLAVVVRDASDAMTVHDIEGRILAWNPSATRIYGWSEEEALRMNIRQRVPSTHQRECLAQIAQLSQSENLAPFKTQRLTKSGEIVNVSITATALLNDSGITYAIATTERLEAKP